MKPDEDLTARVRSFNRTVTQRAELDRLSDEQYAHHWFEKRLDSS